MALSTRSSWKDVLKALTGAQKDMVEWNKEEWGPLTPKSKKKGRYAPKSLRSSLTPSQKTAENRKKRAGTRKGKQHVSRTKAGKKAYKKVEGT